MDWLLNGISTADFQLNVRLFQLVQSFISLLTRFCMLVAVCVLYIFFFSFYTFAFFMYVFDRDVHLYF